MLVYFLRHAEAESGEKDFERELTRKGAKQARKVAKFIDKQLVPPALILTSPLVRARQTADLVAERLELTVTEAEWLSSGMAPESCLRELQALEKPSEVLLSGHEPDFSRAVAFLLGLADADSIDIQKASLVAIELPVVEAGKGKLLFMIPPRLM